MCVPIQCIIAKHLLPSPEEIIELYLEDDEMIEDTNDKTDVLS